MLSVDKENSQLGDDNRSARVRIVSSLGDLGAAQGELEGLEADNMAIAYAISLGINKPRIDDRPDFLSLDEKGQVINSPTGKVVRMAKEYRIIAPVF